MLHRDLATLTAGLDLVRASPRDDGHLDLLVRRGGVGEREVLEEGELTLDHGLVGDSWERRSSKRTPDGSPHPDMQLNIINARFSALISADETQRALAGDQLHVDLDLSEDNVPPGTRLTIGTAVIEVTDQPHTGCAKFTKYFGADARRIANSPAGKGLRLRGLNAKVVEAGTVRRGDVVAKA